MKESKLTLLKKQYQNIKYLEATFYGDIEDYWMFFIPLDYDANKLIEDHYDNMCIIESHWSGNPELETERHVSGKIYIEHVFGGDYEKAFNES